MEKVSLTKEEIVSIREKIVTTQVGTRLNFLKQHKGMKPGKIHLILGAPGGGKSTLRNTLIMDFLLNNPDKNVCIHLSEESIENFKYDLVDNLFMIPFLDRIRISSEQDNPVDDVEFEYDELIENIIRNRAGLFIFDNITTSEFYGDTPTEQAVSSKKIKQSLVNLNCAVVLLAHTDNTVKQSNKRMIDQNEIRGSKKIVNLCEFLYILQTFFQDDTQYTILRIVKHRGSVVTNKVFRLFFNKETRVYDTDFIIDAETYLEFFREPKKTK